MIAQNKNKTKNPPRRRASLSAAHSPVPLGRKLKKRGQTGRRALIVLGMHRSGTSAVASVCNLLGMDLGARLMRPAADNEEGFWELEDIYLAHEELLADIPHATLAFDDPVR